MRNLFLASLLASCVSAALPSIHIKGSKFFTSNGDQFFVKGVAYQLVPDDPLIDTKQCKLDAALMKELGANAIRVYHVDPTANHDGCMSAFEDAGIYLFVDMDTFDTQIEQDSPHWIESQRSAFQKVMDAFAKYDNTAGYFVGNEVLTTGNGSVAAPYVKAAARDLKAYRNSKGYRNIPVGYAAADIATLRPMLQNYLACGDNSSEALDFFALNAYEWCGTDSTYETSGYSQLTQNITSYNIPIFFSETGCNTPKPRTFADQAAIFGPEMTPYWSGSIIYEWIQEANDYGLIKYGEKVDPAASGAPPDGYPRSGTPLPISPDFSNLSGQWKTLSPTGVRESEYNPSLTPPPCPEYTSGVWEVNRDVALPTLGQTFDASVRSSLSVGGGKPTGVATSGASGPAQSSGPANGGPGAVSPGGNVQGMLAGLVGLCVGVFWWL